MAFGGPTFFSNDGQPLASTSYAGSSKDALNLGLSTSVASSAMTVRVKIADGATDPTSGSPVSVSERSATAATGAYNIRSLSAALSIVINSGASLGLLSAVNQFIYVYLLDNAGTLELAVSGSNVWDEGSVQSTTAISGSATSATVLYSTTLRSSVPIRLIGRLRSNQTTSGTYAANATEISMFPFEQTVLLQSGFGASASSQSGNITSATFVNFDNSPTLTLTPKISGIYRVFCNAIIYSPGTFFYQVKINASSGSPTLVREQQGGGSSSQQSVYVFSYYNLIAGTTYTFDLQGQVGAAGPLSTRGDEAAFSIFYERVG